MDKAKIFMNGKSQAVRLPKKYRFDTDEVYIEEHPRGVLLVDPKKQWIGFEEALQKLGSPIFPEGYTQDPWTERDEIK